jgi:hypothetical protein
MLGTSPGLISIVKPRWPALAYVRDVNVICMGARQYLIVTAEVPA